MQLKVTIICVQIFALINLEFFSGKILEKSLFWGLPTVYNPLRTSNAGCKMEGKSLLHIWIYGKAWKKIEATWVEEVDEWLNQGKQDGDIKEVLFKKISREPRLVLC